MQYTKPPTYNKEEEKRYYNDETRSLADHSMPKDMHKDYYIVLLLLLFIIIKTY